MSRAASTSLSVLISVIFLFVLFLVSVLVLTNQILIDYLQNEKPISGAVFGLSLLAILIMLVILGINVRRLIVDIKKDRPGIRYKVRMVLFFAVLVFVSAAPIMTLTANLLRNAFDVWFARDTGDSLRYGVNLALRYYDEKFQSLRRVSISEVLPSLIRNPQRDGEQVWERITDLNPDVQSLQIFGHDEKVIASFGDENLWINAIDIGYLSTAQITRETRGDVSILRALRVLVVDGEEQRVVMSLGFPQGFDAGADLISRTERKLQEIKTVPQSFPLLVFGVYVMFFVPLLLIAVMISLFLADEVVRPLAQLEQAVRTVAQGDYSIRLLARRGDAMGHFVNSFNEMVGELERSRSDLKQSERLQTWQDIAQRMAHEIKNPLTPIKLSAERMLRRYEQKDSEFDKIIQDGVSVIIQEVSAISRMLTEFRDFARLPQPNREVVELVPIIHAAWQIYEPQQKIRFDSTDLPPELNIRADKGQLMQVFKNLFQNAIHAIGESEGEILVRAFGVHRMGQNLIRIHIRDTGSGIEPGSLKDIFHPYFTTKQHGSGLGLAIVEKIVLDHGGRIWAESQPGQGSSFFIDLPRHDFLSAGAPEDVKDSGPEGVSV